MSKRQKKKKKTFSLSNLSFKNLKKLHTSQSKSKSKKHKKAKKRRMVGVGVVLGTSMILSVALTRYSVFGLTFCNKYLVEGIEYRGFIGKVIKVSEPKNIPKFKDKESAIKFVKSIKYDIFTSEPQEVLDENVGNCLGKARLMYFIGKKQGFSVKFIERGEHHVTVEIEGKEYDLTEGN